MRKIRVIPIMIIMVTLMSSCRIDEGDTMKERARYENEIGRIYNQKESRRGDGSLADAGTSRRGDGSLV